MKESKMAFEYNWTQPQQTYAPGGTPYGQASDFFKNNPFQDVYGGLIKNLGGYAQNLFDRSGQNPLYTVGSGGNFNPQTLASTFGFSTGVSPDNPNLPKWMDNLRGGEANITNEAVNQMANANIASSRGGMGVNTGIDPRSQMSQQALQQIAQQYSTDYSKAVGWEQENAVLMNQMAQALVGAYASMYGTDMNTAANILNTQLGATQGQSADLNHYLDLMNQAFQADTGWTNQQIAARPQQQAQAWAFEQQKEKAAQAEAARQRADQLMSSFLSGDLGRQGVESWIQNANLLSQLGYLSSGGTSLSWPYAPNKGKAGIPETQEQANWMKNPYLDPYANYTWSPSGGGTGYTV